MYISDQKAIILLVSVIYNNSCFQPPSCSVTDSICRVSPVSYHLFNVFIVVFWIKSFFSKKRLGIWGWHTPPPIKTKNIANIDRTSSLNLFPLLQMYLILVVYSFFYNVGGECSCNSSLFKEQWKFDFPSKLLYILHTVFGKQNRSKQL